MNMSSRRIRNDLSRFEADFRNYEAVLADIRVVNRNMAEAVTSLNGMWAGKAHDALMAQFKADEADIESLILHLEKLMKKLYSAKKEYTACEKEVNGVAASLQA